MNASSAMRRAGLAATLLASLASCNAEGTEPTKEATCNLGNQPQLADVVTSIAFNLGVLGELGVTVQSAGATKAAPQHDLSILPGQATSFDAAAECMGVDVAAGHLQDFTAGRLVHTGGPVLNYGKQKVSLEGFEVRVGAEPRTFDLVSASGERLLRGTLPHYQLSASGVLDVFNVDLIATPTLAAKWGIPHLSGLVLGTMTFRGQVQNLSAAAATKPGVAAFGAEPLNACNDFSGNVDVALIAMDAVQQTQRSGDQIVIAPSAILKNVGTANVPWQAKFSGSFPPYNTDQHPFLTWGLFREVGGVFEQLAWSDVKHAFLTVNSNCAPGACTIGSVLGLGCEDVYGVGTNGAHLGPRSEITPHSGVWAHCNVPAPNTPSHFDQAAPWCAQDNNGGGESILTHRSTASDAELGVAGANYYFASWYMVRDDINIFNNMGWRKINPSRNGNTWSFGFGSAYRQGSVLDAYIDPAAPTPTRLNITFKDPAAGSVQLGATATDLGNGKWRYVYSIFNHDYSPQLSAITIPVSETAVIEQPKFSDGDEDSSNNWLRNFGIGQVSWTAPTVAARLTWGRMYTITFIANAAPARGTARLTRSDTGAVVTIKSISVGSGAF